LEISWALCCLHGLPNWRSCALGDATDYTVRAVRTIASIRTEFLLGTTVRPVTVTVKKVGEAYTGSTRLKQSDYGMKPVSVAGGTIKVKDEVKVEFSIATK
jgi:hypothetical protein